MDSGEAPEVAFGGREVAVGQEAGAAVVMVLEFGVGSSRMAAGKRMVWLRDHLKWVWRAGRSTCGGW